MTQPSETIAEAARAAASDIQHLEPGPLAQLRRMKRGRVVPAFWKLAAQHPNSIGRSGPDQVWGTVLRILAILTPTAAPAARLPLHDHRRRLGAVLCDGGSASWAGPRPSISEQRLLQLLSARGPQREALLTRAMRAIARSRETSAGVNVVDIARVVLLPESSERLIAKPYYDRLDAATRTTSESEGESTQ